MGPWDETRKTQKFWAINDSKHSHEESGILSSKCVPQETKLAVSRHQVIQAYHEILGRRPENDKVITSHLHYASDKDLRQAFYDSQEYRNLKKMKQKEKERILAHMQKLLPIKGGYPLTRLGEDGDGGYLLPEDFGNIKYAFSPGVSNKVSFEQALYKKYTIRSFLLDGSIESPPEDIGLACADFDGLFLKSFDGDGCTTLETWVNEKTGNERDLDIILQMDIEGSEYEVIISTPQKIINRFRIIVMEIHFLDQLITDEIGIFSAFLKKMNRNHVPVHLHPNNHAPLFEMHGILVPSVLEVTWLRRDRVIDFDPVLNLPHRLDRDNSCVNQSISLTGDWLKSIYSGL